MKAAYLIRCSTKKQDYERQVRDLTMLSKAFGYEPTPLSLIYGEHITGKDDATVRDRLSIQHIKEGVKQKLFDVIFVAEASRMSRDPTSGMWYVRQFTNMGMPVYFKDLEIWTVDPATGRVNPNAESILIGAFQSAAKYLTSMKTQIASGRRSWLAANQLVVGHTQFGYKKLGGRDKFTKNTVVVDEDNAVIVRDIFNSYIQEGATLKSVSLAISNKYGKKFSVSRIEQILVRTEYHTGEYIVTTTDPDTKVKEEFKITFEPILSPEIYEKATKKRKNNRTTTSPYPVQKTHLLSKLIKCPICGRSFSPRVRSGDFKGAPYRIFNGKKAYSWNCMSRINNSNDCSSHIMLNDEKVATIMWELIKEELIYAADLSDDEKTLKIEAEKEKIANFKNDIVNFELQKGNMIKTIDKAYDAYINAPDSVSQLAQERYYETMKKCERETRICDDSITNLQANIMECMNLINFYSQPTKPKDAIVNAEKDQEEMRKLFVELIYKIYPYYVSSGIVVLEAYTINGVYNILLDANTRGYRRLAYYMEGDYAYWQEGKRKDSNAEEGKFFYVPKPVLVTGSEGESITLTFRELSELCSLQGKELVYYVDKRWMDENKKEVIG